MDEYVVWVTVENLFSIKHQYPWCHERVCEFKWWPVMALNYCTLVIKHSVIQDSLWLGLLLISFVKTQDREHHYHNILLIEVKAKAKHMNYLLAFVLEFRWDMYVSVLCKKMGCKTKQTSNFFKPAQTPLLVSDITERKPLETGASPKYEQPVKSHNENLKPNLTVKCVIWINARCICIPCMQKSK